MNENQRSGRIGFSLLYAGGGMDKINECICTEWDKKGWSVCGVPCSIHNNLTKKELVKVYEKRKKMMEQFIQDIKSGKVVKEELPF